MRYFGSQALFVGCAVSLSSCIHDHSLPNTRGDQGASFRIVAMTVAQDTTITAEYEIRVARADRLSRIVSTVFTSGSILTDKGELRFDSRDRQSGDPWPLLIQHAISRAPALIEFSELGAALKINDYDSWRETALTNVGELQLSGQPDFSENPLLEEGGALHDMRRIFPGEPREDGGLIRAVTVAGLQVMVTERCEPEQITPHRVWKCTGELDSIGGSNAKIFGLRTGVELEFSKDGMIRMEAEYVGTSVGVDPTTGELIDQPIAGKRLMERL